MRRLEGARVLVTGAAGGMGRAHCIRLAEEGASVIALDMAASGLDETASAVRDLGGAAVTGIADIRNYEELAAVVADCVAEIGGLDVVVANAGVYDTPGPTWTIDPSVWNRSLDVNLTGTWHTVKACVPHFGNGGSVVLVSSTAGIKGIAGAGHYSSAKHAVVGLARTLANELGAQSIRVNSVHPGSVRTPMIINERVFANLCPGIENPTESDAAAVLSARNLLPVPWVDPVDVSNAVLFLASEESRYMTGCQLVVDAGLTQKV
ncbi:MULTISPECIES: mycofactocin-coupled SDR family oxidoreductase [Rhodococcus]|jgi:NAD(P)-dependent dehydrogenase (short-subunit alcohol dehydrogenase family)|uniref:Mycofactocin-coupled SDR family oxidoreductase n=1 Tax=Rhodococcus globerulus TaxID=33008 RepID=A0ABU4BR24_RHOGO|nr:MULTISPECIES: mycofactocin-coupled SDR family oxidoreductase [Rhodococcus]MCE4264347.1 mycofactocin-coupled SDR family oxidoreductase [Rhodococcus globerulus]MDV6266498.1 mycofactocin-coupled SDR family oxidoreductase [Rhodococcus globerulus]MDV8069657.1 mycofactocin-coupled SDR family oxidoreductase [Rhodococcus sp. IEGM 1366]ROZ49667.1 NAD(P)-dependent oxidoreductase [Rhodococcus sp. WS3]RZL22723.1 MAG: NAD(P)-dependent oxidoreductase [Rhodococcus sp. (in: high G+C Gram-positive bacteria)